MKDSQQHQIISYGSKGTIGQYTLSKPPKAERICYDQALIGRQYGWVKIISSEKRYVGKRHRPYVLTQCTGCGRVQWTLLYNLTSGRSKGCQHCSQPRRVPLWLYQRIMWEKQRCENPKNTHYKDYGGRGIKFKFPSVLAAGLWVMQNLGLPENKKLELDRVDNNGNYEPGNLRWVTRSQNCLNQRKTVLTEFQQEYWPYAKKTVLNKLSAGETREQIIQDAQKAVREKRKNWRGIQRRLASMTLKMPDQITVLPYRGNSSTTADMAAASER